MGLISQTASAGPGTNVVTNGSFESGLTGWTFAASDTNQGTGPCGYNGAVGTTGTETLTTTVGFPATDLANVALGSIHQTTAGSGIRYACVLYQDITLPSGTLSATLSYDVGIKLLSGQPAANTGVQIGLYSTASVPNDTGDGGTPLIPGTSTFYQTGAGDTTLQHQSFSIPTTNTQLQNAAGTTVRLAILLVVNANTGPAVVGLDNVQLVVSATGVPGTPIPSSFFMLGAGIAGLIGWSGWRTRRLRAN